MSMSTTYKNAIMLFITRGCLIIPNPAPLAIPLSASLQLIISEKITWLSSKYYKDEWEKGEVIKEGKFNRRMFPRPKLLITP